MVRIDARFNHKENEEWILNENEEAGYVVVNAKKQAAANSISSFLKSDVTKKYLTYSESILIDEKKNEGNIILSLTVEGKQILGSDPPEETDWGSVVIQGKDKKAEIVSLLDFPSREPIINSDPIMPSSETLKKELFDFIRENQMRVSLGYGPQHPLDNIQPVSGLEDISKRSMKHQMNALRNWIKSAATKTINTGNEYGFYVDARGNVVGMIEGTTRQISYPPMELGRVPFRFHTHPSLKALSFPSKQDIASAITVGGDKPCEMIVNPNYHHMFYDRQELLNRRTNPEYYISYPFKKAPATHYRLHQDWSDEKRNDYYDKIKPELKAWMGKQILYKRMVIQEHEDEMHENIYNVKMGDINDAETIIDQVFSDGSAWDYIRNMSRENDVAFEFDWGWFNL